MSSDPKFHLTNMSRASGQASEDAFRWNFAASILRMGSMIRERNRFFPLTSHISMPNFRSPKASSSGIDIHGTKRYLHHTTHRLARDW